MYCIKEEDEGTPWQNLTCLPIDLLAILQKSLDRALFLYIFIHEIRSSGVRASTTIVHIRKFYKMHHNIVRFRFFPRIGLFCEANLRRETSKERG